MMGPMLKKHTWALSISGLGGGPFASDQTRLHSNREICIATVMQYLQEAHRRRKPYAAHLYQWDGGNWAHRASWGAAAAPEASALEAVQ